METIRPAAASGAATQGTALDRSGPSGCARGRVILREPAPPVPTCVRLPVPVRFPAMRPSCLIVLCFAFCAATPAAGQELAGCETQTSKQWTMERLGQDHW